MGEEGREGTAGGKREKGWGWLRVTPKVCWSLVKPQAMLSRLEYFKSQTSPGRREGNKERLGLRNTALHCVCSCPSEYRLTAHLAALSLVVFACMHKSDCFWKQFLSGLTQPC